MSKQGFYLWANDVCDLINVYSVLEIISGLVLNYFVNSDVGLFELRYFHCVLLQTKTINHLLLSSDPR